MIDWKDFKSNPPEYRITKTGRNTKPLLLCNSRGEMCVGEVRYLGMSGGGEFISVHPTGVDGMEWDFEWEEDIRYWAELPEPPKGLKR